MNPLFLAAFLAFAGAAPAAAEHVPLSALPTGRCAGDAAPGDAPQGGAPYALDAAGRRDLPEWNSLGYKENASGGLTSPNGRTVGAAFAAWMNAPEDFSRVSVPKADWSALMLRGYRLDEESCALTGPEGTLTRLDFLASRENARRWYEKTALEQMKADLAGLDPTAPVPPALIDDAKSLASAGVALPPEVAKLLAAPGVRAGALGAGVDAAYADATLYFDGELASREAVGVPAEGAGARTPARAAEERTLSALFAADLEKKFSRTPEGRELLERFRGADGKVRLPEILFVKGSQRPSVMQGATFDPGSGAMTMDHWTAAAIALAGVPPAEGEARSREFSDPRNLGRYLESHPEARAALVDEFDSGFFHEFVHAWQARRSSYGDASARGDVPENTPLVMEHEAYREQCRYEFGLLLSDPAAIEKRHYAGLCLTMLKDYAQFREGISRLYLGTFAGTSELPDLVKIQAERESTVSRLMDRGLYREAFSAKLAGMRRGDAALHDLERDSARREREFAAGLPSLRARVLRELPPAYQAAGRPDLALLILNHLPDDQPGLAAARRAWVEASQQAVIDPGPRFALPARMAVLQAIAENLHEREAPWPPALLDANWRDVRAVAAGLIDQGLAAKDPASRAGLLKAAAGWIDSLPAGDPLRRRLAAARGS